MPQYDFHPSLTKATAVDYEKLFTASFPNENKLNVQYLDWLYCLNPHGKAIGWDAFYGGELVAHYCVIPRKYNYLKHEYKAVHSVNTATHPLHQGNGLFIKLANLTYDTAYELGASFVVGVANASSIGGFQRKLGFSIMGQIKLYPGFRRDMINENKLELLVDEIWINWRMSNPSRKYSYLDGAKDSVVIKTSINGVPFNIGSLKKDLFQENNVNELIKKGNRLIPGITPYFHKNYQSIACLPARFQPSPWWVIWRTLDKSIPSTLAGELEFNGLSMDTF
jgi:hypothetical protein